MATITVLPKTNLQVTLSDNALTYTQGFTTFTVTVVNLTSGAAEPNVRLEFSVPNAPIGTTNSQGQYVFAGFIGAAGNYNVTATKDIGGTTAPEFRGLATFVVNAAPLTVTPLTSTILAGFDTIARWNVTFANNGTGFLNTTTPQFVNFTASIGGVTYAFNHTSPATGTALDDQNNTMTVYGSGYADSGNTTNDVCAGEAQLWTSGAQLAFRPCGTWPSGTATFTLRASTSGDEVVEYSQTWTLVTSAPNAVNLRVLDGGNQRTNLTVLQATGLPASPVAGNYDLQLRIEGDVLGQFPGDLGAYDTFSAANVTITGEVLPGYTIDATGVDGDGLVDVTNLVPTRYGGTVNFHVVWKNTTTTISLPIVGGALLASDVSEIRVDQSSSFTVTLTDQYGNPIPDGDIYVFDGIDNGTYAGIGQYSISGTGAPGVGQNGQYTLTLRPTTVGDLTVYGVIGTAFQNYTYLRIRVVPAHDLEATVSVNSTMAALKTYVFVNATLPNGVGTYGATTPASTGVWFVNATQLADLQANGTLPAATYGWIFHGGTPTATTGAQNAANSLGVVDATASAAGFNMNVSLPAGTYAVYVCSDFNATLCTDAKHDNLNNTPTLVVNPYSASFSPDQVANNPDIQQNQVVNVTVVDADGNPAYGTLKLAPSANVSLFGAGTSSNITTNVSIVNGTGSFTITGVATGTLAFEFDPWGDSYTAFAAVPETFGIVGPAVTVDPSNIPVGTTSSITVTVKSLNGSALADRVVRICGQPIGGSATAPTTITANTTGCTGERTTDSNGVARFAVLPNADGTLYLYVNNTRTTTTIAVVAGLVLSISPSSPSVGDSVTITVNQPGQTGESGVAITVMRGNETVLNQTTGSAGQVVLPNVAAGNYTVTATKAGFEAATLNFTVEEGEAPTTGAEFSLENLDVPSTGAVGAGITVSADVVNSGDEAGTATVLLIVDGAVRDSQNVPVSADGRETVAFDFTPNTAKAYRVTVRLAGGETLAEKTVEVSTPTTPTGPTGPTEPTGPTGPTGPTEPTEPTGVPGFELVALVGALAAALLVFRRRQN